MATDDPFEETSGPVFKMALAEREQVPALVALWGFSDSGKTFSALRLARGIVGPSGKIALIDTENKRAKLYADLFGGWHHIDMQPPFTPARYTAAYDAAIKGGADIVIVDSQSHVWEGEGGVLDQADASADKGLAKWKAPKMAYKRMTNALFRSPVHMIFCIRAKEKFVQIKNNNKTEIVSAGPTPICDSRFIYEMTVAIHMESGERKPGDHIKAPDAIASVIRPHEFITEEMGAKIAEWLAGGISVDPEMIEAQKIARDVATFGVKRFTDHWQKLTREQRKHINPIRAELKAIAEEADKTETETRAVESDDPFADNFTKTAA